MERDNTRMKYFLASLSQSQMACDSGLFHSCNTASNKDGRTVLFLVINWVFVGVKILPALTSRQVLTQRRGKEGERIRGPIYFDQSCFLTRSSPQTGPRKQSSQTVRGLDTWKQALSLTPPLVITVEQEVRASRSCEGGRLSPVARAGLRGLEAGLRVGQRRHWASGRVEFFFLFLNPHAKQNTAVLLVNYAVLMGQFRSLLTEFVSHFRQTLPLFKDGVGRTLALRRTMWCKTEPTSVLARGAVRHSCLYNTARGALCYLQINNIPWKYCKMGAKTLIRYILLQVCLRKKGDLLSVNMF